MHVDITSAYRCPFNKYINIYIDYVDILFIPGVNGMVEHKGKRVVQTKNIYNIQNGDVEILRSE